MSLALMRSSTAFGLFFAAFGLLVLVLHPVYDIGGGPPSGELEASGPPSESRVIPDWAGVASMILGGLLVLRRAPRGR